MRIIKLLATGLLVFSLNVNASANQTNPFALGYSNNTDANIAPKVTVIKPLSGSSSRPLAPNYGADLAVIADSVDSIDNNNVSYSRSNDNSADANQNALKPVNLKAKAFVRKLFTTASFYIKWLTVLEKAIKNDTMNIMDDFLANNGCSSCTYQEIIQVFEVKKAANLFFWTGNYQTNLTSASGTGRKLGLTIGSQLKVKFNKVIGTSLKIDGEAIFGATFKDHKLIWNYGTNMQANNSKGNITFAEVILDGKYIGHQFTGTLVWRSDISGEQTQSFVGFTHVAMPKTKNDKSKGDTDTGGGLKPVTDGDGLKPGAGGGLKPVTDGDGLKPGNKGGNGNNSNNNDINPITGKPQMSIGFIDYSAKKFGTQIWTTENMRHYPSKVGNGFWTDIDAAGNEFKYYDWNAAMNGETKEGAQGICATGWRIPTDGDWNTLEGFLGKYGAPFLIGGSSGFDARLLGYRSYKSPNRVKNRGTNAGFTSATSTSITKLDLATNTIYHVNRRYIARYIDMPKHSLVWRGSTVMKQAMTVRCVKDSGDASISSDTPKKLILEVGKPMTPLGFGDTVTSVAKKWAINPALDNGLSFDTTRGLMSGTPLAVKDAVDYSVTTVDDSKAVSTITITVVDDIIMVSSIQITGNNQLKVGESTQLSATISPSYASNKEVVWSIVGTDSKATISQTGELTALKSGNVKVAATTVDHSATYGIFDVSITTTSNVEADTKNYVEITSKKTGRIWLDRNLGASKACVSTTDSACYGDLYQWGRAADGHQLRSVVTLGTKPAKSITPPDGIFVTLLDDWTELGVDDLGNKRQLAWTSDHINSICPVGFSLPTKDELIAEVDDSSTPIGTYFASSSLKLPLNGLRDKTGQEQSSGINGYYWTQDVINLNPTPDDLESSASVKPGDISLSGASKSTTHLSGNLIVNSDSTYLASSHHRAAGMGVRCIKDAPPFISPSVNDLQATAGTAITAITFTNLGRIATQWEITPALSVGLSFNEKTGVISGTPSESMSATHYHITASNAFGTDTARVRITVAPNPIMITGIQISNIQSALKVNDVVQLRAIISPSNAGNNFISWSSSDANIATVDHTGLVTSIKNGKVTIFAHARRNPTVFDSVSIAVEDYRIDNKTYNAITSPKTGRVWLDRNLGASRVCRSVTDIECYGDLYQFGRTKDGHQNRANTSFSSTQVTSITPNKSTFIIMGGGTAKDWTTVDQSGVLRNVAWNYEGINNICPAGFSVPTVQELRDEKIGVYSTVPANFLKLSLAGKRSNLDGVFSRIGISGHYWTRSSSANYQAQNLHLKSNSANFEGDYRNQGFSVRCIQNETMEAGGIRYKAIKIGRQVWTIENMRHGTNAVNSISSYKDVLSNDKLYGKYYTWDAAMNGSTKQGAQGICATGWHIPTDNDWKILENDLGMSDAQRDKNVSWRGTDQGTQLKTGGSSGFNAVMTGVIRAGNSILLEDGYQQTYLWSSKEKASDTSRAWKRALDKTKAQIYSGNAPKSDGASVRCVKDVEPMRVGNIQYKIVNIDQQVWTAEHMRHGVNSAAEGIFSYQNMPKFDKQYGKLYTWSAAMKGSTTAGAQGICATGWHIPTDNDWKILEGALGMSKAQQDLLGYWRGTDQGQQLSIGGTSGFDTQLSGVYESSKNSFYGRDSTAFIWSSSKGVGSHNRAYTRYLGAGPGRYKVYRFDTSQLPALSTRCIRNY